MKWTEFELNILKTNYNLIDNNKLLRLLPNRNLKSIQNMAYKLSLTNKNRWEQEDIELLKDCINNKKLSLKEIYKIFNGKFRINGITDKIYKLGLSLDYNRWLDYEIKILIDNYNKLSNKEMEKLLPNRKSNEISDKASKLKLKKDEKTLIKIRNKCNENRNNIWTKHESNLILQHYKNSGTEVLSKLIPNRSIDAIRAQAKKLGIKFEKNKWTNEMTNYLIESYKNFNDIYELTANFNILFNTSKTYNSINSKLGHLDLSMTDIVKIAKKNEKEIIKLINEGYSDKELSKIYFCGEKHIALLRTQNGIRYLEKWTDCEIDLLYKIYPTYNIKDICDLIINRSWHVIKWKANKLNIKRLVSNMTNKIEDKDLDSIWQRMKREEKSYQGNSWEDYERMSYDEIEYMYGYFDKKCIYCGEEYREITFDHFVPMSKGGRLTKDNTIICCLDCNSSKQDRDFKIWYLNKDFKCVKNNDKYLQIDKIYSYLHSFN